MILADLNVILHLPMAVRSATDVVGGWQTAQRWLQCFVHAGPGSRIDAVFADRIAKHSLCDVGLVGAIGIFSHVPVAAVFPLAEMNKRQQQLHASGRFT